MQSQNKLKKEVWQINTIGIGGIDAKTDIAMGVDENNKPAIRIGEYIFDGSASGLPEGGEPGNILTKTEDGAEWKEAGSGLPEGAKDGDVLAFETEYEYIEEPITPGHTYKLKSHYNLSEMPQPSDEDHKMSNFHPDKEFVLKSLSFNIDKIKEVGTMVNDGNVYPLLDGAWADNSITDPEILSRTQEICEMIDDKFSFIIDVSTEEDLPENTLFYMSSPDSDNGWICFNNSDSEITISDGEILLKSKTLYYVMLHEDYTEAIELDTSKNLIIEVAKIVFGEEAIEDIENILNSGYVHAEITTDTDEFDPYKLRQIYIINDKQVEIPFELGWSRITRITEDIFTLHYWNQKDNKEYFYMFEEFGAGFSGWVTKEGQVGPDSISIIIPENFDESWLVGLDSLQDLSFMLEPNLIPIEVDSKAKWKDVVHALAKDPGDGDILSVEVEKEVEPITAGHTYTLKKEYNLSDMPQPTDEDHYISNNNWLKDGSKIHTLQFNLDKIAEIMPKFEGERAFNILGLDGDAEDEDDKFWGLLDNISTFFGEMVSAHYAYGEQYPEGLYVTGPEGIPAGLFINTTNEDIDVEDFIGHELTVTIPSHSVCLAGVQPVEPFDVVFEVLDNSRDLIKQVMLSDLFSYEGYDEEYINEALERIYVVDPDRVFNAEQIYIIDGKQVERPFAFGWRADEETLYVYPINNNSDALFYVFPEFEEGYVGWIIGNNETGNVQPYTGSLDITIPEDYTLHGLNKLQDIEFLFEQKETPIEGSEKAKWIKNPVPSYTENDVGKSLVVTKTGGEVKLGIPLKLKESYTIQEVAAYMGANDERGYSDDDEIYIECVYFNDISDFPFVTICRYEDPDFGYCYLFSAGGHIDVDGWYMIEATEEGLDYIPANPPETITLSSNIDIEEHGYNISSIQDLAFFFDLGEVEIKPEWKSDIGNSVFNFCLESNQDISIRSTINCTAKELYDYIIKEFTGSFRFPHFQTVAETEGGYQLGVWYGGTVTSIRMLLEGNSDILFIVNTHDNTFEFDIRSDGSINNHEVE